uniref:Uncharacterized protein n=1 Tax=Megaselia scalaris TaxID=36166 RepID=T1GIX2_MEGSC
MRLFYKGSSQLHSSLEHDTFFHFELYRISKCLLAIYTSNVLFPIPFISPFQSGGKKLLFPNIELSLCSPMDVTLIKGGTPVLFTRAITKA